MLDNRKEQEDIERIFKLKKEDWQPMLDLIPEIERTTEFGEMKNLHWIESSIIEKFRNQYEKLDIKVRFDWSRWNEGREIANNEQFDFNKIDIPTKCKLITAIMRNDRFCEGALISAFESGVILKILKSIKFQLESG